MTVEAAGFIDDIDPTQPPGTDNFSEGDNHLRNFKKSVQDSLPNISGAMTATHTELNNLDGYTGNTADLNVVSGANAGGLTAAELLYVAGVTSDIQTQLNAKMTGSNNLSELTDTGIARANLDMNAVNHNLYYLGSGDDGSKTVSSNETWSFGEYHYTSLTINSGWTVGLSSGSYLIIRVTGTCTIAGTIDLDGDGSSGAVQNTGTDGATGTSGSGGGSGGAGGGDDSTNIGGDGSTSLLRETSLAGGVGDTGTGNNGSAPSTGLKNIIQSQAGGGEYLFLGSGGGSGANRTGWGGAGGDGGGTLVIIADTLDFQSGASITARGSAGAVGNSNAGGGGGGGGGVVFIAASTVTNAGTITLAGGAGGAGSGGGDAGGTGGAGYSKINTL